MYFKALPQPDIENGLTFLTLDQVKMDFSVKDIKMGVENISNGNLVIRECATIGWTGETRVYMFFVSFRRGRPQSVYQQQQSGAAQGNEAGTARETDAGHAQFHRQAVREDTAGSVSGLRLIIETGLMDV